MRPRVLFALVVILVLLLEVWRGVGAQGGESPAAAGPSAATSSPGPCVVGGAYNPACDVNFDGKVDVRDAQAVAGNWGQSGTWTGPVAFVHTALGSDYSSTVIDNAFTNNAPGAILVVTPRGANADYIAVRYNESEAKWTIYNVNFAPLTNIQFNVIAMKP